MVIWSQQNANGTKNQAVAGSLASAPCPPVDPKPFAPRRVSSRSFQFRQHFDVRPV